MNMTEQLQERINVYSKRRLERLKERTKRCRCKYCGGELKLKRIEFSEYEDARIEIYCEQCGRIEYGVEPEIYQSAKFFVESTNFNCFPDLSVEETTKQMTVAKVCEIMAWQDQNLGILNEDGFCVPLSINKKYMGECIILSETDLQSDTQEKDVIC